MIDLFEQYPSHFCTLTLTKGGEIVNLLHKKKLKQHWLPNLCQDIFYKFCNFFFVIDIILFFFKIMYHIYCSILYNK